VQFTILFWKSQEAICGIFVLKCNSNGETPAGGTKIKMNGNNGFKDISCFIISITGTNKIESAKS
jgi:hypothetical protein